MRLRSNEELIVQRRKTNSPTIEEDFTIDFSKTAEVKTDFVDDIPLDFEITDDPNNHKSTVKRVTEDVIEVEQVSEEQVKEAKDVDWSFDLNADEEE